MIDPNVRISLGVKWRWMDTWGLRYILNHGVIELYDAPLPASPDAPPGSASLGRITTGGLPFTPGVRAEGALRLHQPEIGRLIIAPGDDWVLTATRTGTAVSWRWLSNMADPNVADPIGEFPRLDGLVGGALLLASPQLVAGQQRPVAGFFLQFAS